MSHGLSNVLDFFSVLGEASTDFGRGKFDFHRVEGWLSPSFSPLVLLPGRSLNHADLESIEEYIRQHPIRNPALNPAPYFNFFTQEGLYNTEAIRSVCNAAGWTIDEDPLSVEFVTDRKPVSTPPGIVVTVVDATNSGLHPEYREVLRRNFRADEAYLSEVEMAYRRARALSYTVLLGSDTGVTLGGGTISMRNSLGFLTWGSINPEYRNQGLHRLLLSACVKVAMNHGVKTCAFTTRNKFIRRKWDSFSEMHICRKSTKDESKSASYPIGMDQS